MIRQLHDWFVNTDFNIWYYLNCLWRNDFLDTIMPFIRNQYFWAPLYLFLLVFILYNYGAKGLAWCIGFLLCFAFGDLISGSVIKPLVGRMRPCTDPRLADYVQLIVPRSTGYSFPSSHATNHFAMGVFIAKTFHRRLKWLWPLPVFWALSVGYAQVYVGVHFPFDVLCGALLGSVIGLLVAKLYHRYFTLSLPPGQRKTGDLYPDI